MEDYSYLNMTELELAFRQNGGGKAFGASMNLSLIQEVLDDFKVVRLEVARKANQEAANALRIDPMTDDELINEARAEIEFYYQQIRRGNNRPITFPFWAEVLKQDRFIQEESQMENFFTFCLEKSVKNIYTCEATNSI
jgi:tRNA A37 N6-isopentenylltransferase MiaA